MVGTLVGYAMGSVCMEVLEKLGNLWLDCAETICTAELMMLRSGYLDALGSLGQKSIVYLYLGRSFLGG